MNFITLHARSDGHPVNINVACIGTFETTLANTDHPIGAGARNSVRFTWGHQREFNEDAGEIGRLIDEATQQVSE